MPLCKSCGNEANPDKKFCDLCGEPIIRQEDLSVSATGTEASTLTPAPPPPPSSSYPPVSETVKPKKPRSDMIVLAGLCVVAIIAMLIYTGFPWIKMENKDTPDAGSTFSPTFSPTLVPTIKSTSTFTPTTMPTPISVFPESSRFTALTTVTGQSGRTSDTFSVPGGYWELWYTADPIILGGQDSVSASGSNSAVFPYLSIQVIDKTNSNRVVETVEPPGGLDKTLWAKSGIDPRPWKQKFYEGNKEYYFVITANHIKSYTIQARIPKSS